MHTSANSIGGNDCFLSPCSSKCCGTTWHKALVYSLFTGEASSQMGTAQAPTFSFSSSLKKKKIREKRMPVFPSLSTTVLYLGSFVLAMAGGGPCCLFMFERVSSSFFLLASSFSFLTTSSTHHHQQQQPQQTTMTAAAALERATAPPAQQAFLLPLIPNQSSSKTTTSPASSSAASLLPLLFFLSLYLWCGRQPPVNANHCPTSTTFQSYPFSSS